MRSREEVQKLKADWRRDPCYEIEETPSFEEHAEELRAYREEFERRNRELGDEILREKAARIGCPGNLDLAGYVEGLELSIERLSERLDVLEGA